MRALTNRAYALARLARYQEAIVDYTSIIALEPLNSHAYHNRGISHDKLGQQSSAISDFSMVLELDATVGSAPVQNEAVATPRGRTPLGQLQERVPADAQRGHTSQSSHSLHPPSKQLSVSAFLSQIGSHS